MAFLLLKNVSTNVLTNKMLLPAPNPNSTIPSCDTIKRVLYALCLVKHDGIYIDVGSRVVAVAYIPSGSAVEHDKLITEETGISKLPLITQPPHDTDQTSRLQSITPRLSFCLHLVKRAVKSLPNLVFFHGDMHGGDCVHKPLESRHLIPQVEGP